MFNPTDLREDIALLFVEAGRRHDVVTLEMWVVANEAREARRRQDRFAPEVRSKARRYYRDVIRADPEKLAFKRKHGREAQERYRTKNRATSRKTVVDPQMRRAIIEFRGVHSTKQTADHFGIGQSTVRRIASRPRTSTPRNAILAYRQTHSTKQTAKRFAVSIRTVSRIARAAAKLAEAAE